VRLLLQLWRPGLGRRLDVVHGHVVLKLQRLRLLWRRCCGQLGAGKIATHSCFGADAGLPPLLLLCHRVQPHDWLLRLLLLLWW
jgi:hypothetical protein